MKTSAFVVALLCSLTSATGLHRHHKQHVQSLISTDAFAEAAVDARIAADSEIGQ